MGLKLYDSAEMKLLLCLIVCSVAAIDLPPNFPICKRNDPNLNECIKNGYNVIVPTLVNGIPELNLKAFLPVKVDAVSIDEGSGPVKVVQHYKNAEFLELETSRAKSVQASVTDDNFKIVFDIFAPNVTMYADYDFNGFILFLPMVGEGKATITILDVKMGVEMVGEVFTRNGVKYAKVNSIVITYDPKGGKYEFTNLFNGDEQLGREMNHILNAEWKSLFDDVHHGYAEALAEGCKSFLNRLFAIIPYDDLFPM